MTPLHVSRRARRLGRRSAAGIAGAVAAAAITLLGAGTAGAAPSGPQGIDVSHHQGAINWSAVARGGVKFAYLKATEGTSYVDSQFGANYTHAYRAGVIRGAYHFANPAGASGATQAAYFLAHGGGWSADGKTLPGALDIEYNPSGATCYGLSARSMVSWIRDFRNTYHAKTGRWPLIYTTTDWWTQCTGNYAGFAKTSPLWLARYNSTPGTLPAGWSFTTIWQYADKGAHPGDQDVFNGSADGLKRLALGSAHTPPSKSPTARPTTPPSSPSTPPSATPSASASASKVASHSPTAAPSSPPSESAPTLPVTGTSLGLLAGAGAVLVAGGVTVYVLSRRRRMSD